MNKMATAVATKAKYKHEMIHCTCGTAFPVGLEGRLSDYLWEDDMDNHVSDEETYKCPHCNMSYELDIALEKTISLLSATLQPLGQLITNEFDNDLDVSLLQNFWIGDAAVLGRLHSEEMAFPDGVYVTSGKEYRIEEGIVQDYWSMTDDNQLLLLEESLI
jgi:hypothetical protein